MLTERNFVIPALIIFLLVITACGKKGELEPPNKNGQDVLMLTAKD